MADFVNCQGWDFNFDKDETAKYYAGYDGFCSCAMCRNYYGAIAGLSNELRRFLEQFGIDIAKPIETWSVIADKNEKTAEYTAFYAVHGVAKSLSRDEIDIDTMQIVVQTPESGDPLGCPEHSPNTEIKAPYFVFEIIDLWLPWVIEDNIDSVYTEKKSLTKEKQTLFSILFRSRGKKRI